MKACSGCWLPVDFDYFSRSVIEIYEELASRKQLYPKMVVEETILLYYPLPLYFVVNKADKN